MSCTHSEAEHEYRKRASQWPKQRLVGIQRDLAGRPLLELRNCENEGTMGKRIDVVDVEK